MGLGVAPLTTKRKKQMENSITQFLNNDVTMTLASHKAGVSHCENLIAMVNAVNLNSSLIDEYLKGFESACIAQGMSKNSVKVLKSNRKCIMEFSIGARKGQEDKELWNPEACKQMAVELGMTSSDISDYAKACRQALSDEKPEPEFDIEKEFRKLIEKAKEKGADEKKIRAAFNKGLKPLNDAILDEVA